MNKADYNLDIIESLVSTQYGDYGGYIQIDGHSGVDFFKLCEDHGVSRDKYFLIGFGCGESTINGIGQRDVNCRALVLETSRYGNSFDEIQKNLASKSGRAKAKQIHFSVKYESFTKCVKRFDFMVSTKLTKHISEIEVEDIF
ncbi:hypothetical protein [Flavobacterium inviolabile]|uniref:hypothetical protein n=1 Tax=Flavobacterium inviolabile TaxID=2748320 RepID=UPI0015ACF501|nr:hypothetical protein [Flavobacterium inviolabile]